MAWGKEDCPLARLVPCGPEQASPSFGAVGYQGPGVIHRYLSVAPEFEHLGWEEEGLRQ